MVVGGVLVGLLVFIVGQCRGVLQWAEFSDTSCTVSTSVSAELQTSGACTSTPASISINYNYYTASCDGTAAQINWFYDSACTLSNATNQVTLGSSATTCQVFQVSPQVVSLVTCQIPSPSPSPSSSPTTRTKQVLFYCRIKNTATTTFESYQTNFIQALFLTLGNYDDMVPLETISITKVESYSLGTQVLTSIASFSSNADTIKQRVVEVFANGQFQAQFQLAISEPKELALEGQVLVAAISSGSAAEAGSDVPDSYSGGLDVVSVIFILLAIVLTFLGCVAFVLYKIP